MKKIFNNIRTLSGFIISEAAFFGCFYAIGLGDYIGIFAWLLMLVSMLAMMLGFRLMGKGLVHRESLAVWFYKLYNEAK